MLCGVRFVGVVYACMRRPGTGCAWTVIRRSRGLSKITGESDGSIAYRALGIVCASVCWTMPSCPWIAGQCRPPLSCTSFLSNVLGRVCALRKGTRGAVCSLLNGDCFPTGRLTLGTTCILAAGCYVVDDTQPWEEGRTRGDSVLATVVVCIVRTLRHEGERKKKDSLGRK